MGNAEIEDLGNNGSSYKEGSSAQQRPGSCANHTLTLAVITDLHAGPDIYVNGRNGASKKRIKEGPAVPSFLDQFVAAANIERFDAVIETGDRISSQSPLMDAFNMYLVRQSLSRLTIPHFYIPGNNEVRFLKKKDIENLTGHSVGTRSIIKNEINLVLWTPSLDTKKRLRLTQKDLEQLESALGAGGSRPAILFSHVPLDNNSEKHQANLAARNRRDTHGRYGNFHYVNSHEARQILERQGNVMLCSAGHKHRNKFKVINDIPYLTVNSPVGLRYPDWQPEFCYAILRIDPVARKTEVEVQGRKPRLWQHKFS